MRRSFMISILAVFSYFGALKAQECQARNSVKPSKYINKILKIDDLERLIEDATEDNLIQVEIQASILFNEILNQYRAEKKLKPMEWNIGLWMAARNHSIYMTNEEFSHMQTKKISTYYTGYKFFNRLNYVLSSPAANNLAGGENLVMFYMHPEQTITYYVNIAFQRWKNSPGHNKNMLNPIYSNEGTSLYLDLKSNCIYGTSVFFE